MELKVLYECRMLLVLMIFVFYSQRRDDMINDLFDILSNSPIIVFCVCVCACVLKTVFQLLVILERSVLLLPASPPKNP